MNTYILLFNSNSPDEIYKDASKIASRFGEHNISSVVKYNDEKIISDKMINQMVDMYISLKKSNFDLIEKFKNKVKDDDFLLNQMKENLIRFNKHSYKYPEEWKIVFFDGEDFNHIDDYSYLNELKSRVFKDSLYIAMVDLP